MIKCTVPFVGGRIEKFAAEWISKYLNKEAARRCPVARGSRLIVGEVCQGCQTRQRPGKYFFR